MDEFGQLTQYNQTKVEYIYEKYHGFGDMLSKLFLGKDQYSYKLLCESPSEP